jgi:hypothetical protein
VGSQSSTQRIIILVTVLLVASLALNGWLYSKGAATSIYSTTQTVTSFATEIKPIVTTVSSVSTIYDTSPCSQKPLQYVNNYTASTNGFGVRYLYYPVFTLKPGSQGTLCYSYENNQNSTWNGSLSISLFEWPDNSLAASGINIRSNSPENMSIPPQTNVTVVYTVQASATSSGYYGYYWPTICGGPNQLLVSTDPSSASFSDFKGLLANLTSFGWVCYGGWQIPQDLIGYGGGLGMMYLENTSNFVIPYNETSESVSSMINSKGDQNITFKAGIQSFSLPLQIGFVDGPIDFHYIRQWSGNPELTPTNNTCDWTVTNQSAFPNDIQLPIQGISINAPTLSLAPFSSGTFTYSMLISNLTAGYYGTFLTFYVSWGADNNTNLNLGTFFPISVGSGQWDEPINGSCIPY